MADWLIIVDDDTMNLQVAGHILSKSGMRVTALKSGQALLNYCSEHGFPDMLLLDIKMPVMDGFETLKRFRELEKQKGVEEVPVIFLTADENSGNENLGFNAGASDFMRKPFVPEVLLHRIDSILKNRNRIKDLKIEATTDKLTGFLNKATVGNLFPEKISRGSGCLMMIDLDSFKLVNDIYGHSMGDSVLSGFAKILRECIPEPALIGRIGGDEFIAYIPEENSIEDVSDLCLIMNRMITDKAKKLMGENFEIPLGASIGAVFVPEYGRNYQKLTELADKALYQAKKNGKRTSYVFNELPDENNDGESDELNLGALSSILGERNIPNTAYQLDKNGFSYVYQFVMRYITRNQRSACKVLFTLNDISCKDESHFSVTCERFDDYLKDSLRKSDFLMRNRINQFFVFLTDIHEAAIKKVIGNIIKNWHELYGESVSITYEAEYIGSVTEKGRPQGEAKIVVVDDDSTNLQIAGRILSKAGFFVTALRSGSALIDFLENNIPDLILLDVKMPEMDGYETLRKIRNMGNSVSDIPVIYLTADDSSESESEGLSLGAMDYLKKPFVPDVLLQRVRHIVDLTTLQKNLSYEIEKKTRENNELFKHVIQALAEAIDAKDRYTKGHSGRVADYAFEIARRYGYGEKKLDDIYMMSLLHDVGKIGVPDAVINKPSKLTDEEFEFIKNHPVMGSRILKRIQEKPELIVGAKWHHEKYDGTGYPDGLKGEEIPEEARIIAVADAYDAMSSNRSYRGILPQSVVRDEIIKGRGTQFDPKFADIMLAMIDEDKDYTMKENDV